MFFPFVSVISICKLGGLNSTSYLSWSSWSQSPKWVSLGKSQDVPRASSLWEKAQVENLFPCLLQLLKAEAHGHFLHLQSQQHQAKFFSHRHLSSFLLFPSFPFKETCEFTGPTWIIQNNLPKVKLSATLSVLIITLCHKPIILTGSRNQDTDIFGMSLFCLPWILYTFCSSIKCNVYNYFLDGFGCGTKCCGFSILILYPTTLLKKVKVKSLSRVWLFVTPWTTPTRLLCPWDFPGKNTGVGCHFLLQGIFPTQGSNQVSCIAGRCFTLYALAWWQRHRGSPNTAKHLLILINLKILQGLSITDDKMCK